MDGVIVPSEYLKRMVMGWDVPESKIQVIYNALPTLPQMSESKTEARQALGWDERPTILTAARLHPWKGLDHLITATRDLPDIRLIVAGDGYDLGRLKAMAHERVSFLGQVPAEQMPRLLRAVDALAVYSGYEGLSHTILESLQIGTPVIASDMGGNPELVQDGVNGLLVPYVDIPALKSAIERLIAERDKFASQTYVGMESFTFEQMLGQTDAYLRRFVNN
jgi:glycosyltransferase involved in cell wall biosynthesis